MVSKSLPSLENDLYYLDVATEQLEEYLLSSEIYWSGGTYSRTLKDHYPSLTLGWVLFYLQRSRALIQTPSQDMHYARVHQAIDVLRFKWRHAWEVKAQAEFSSRLRLWRDFLNEYQRDPENHYDRYRYEVHKRALLELLGQEAVNLQQAEYELLASLDALLKAHFIPGDFIWEVCFSSAFPKDTYWYLYGNLANK